MQPKLIIMRGLPGSGKSFYVQQNYPDATVCSADSYFIGADGVYRFDRRDLRQAHEDCREKARLAMLRGDQVVVIDNTNIQRWEFEPYLKMAHIFGYVVEELCLVADPDRCAERNVHGVPLETINAMARRFEK